ncbi:MAG: hypothetical protein HRT64_03625 [Erythrobacter sp.]|nr:hypothetical protein [Erythrobacter sp.]
MYESLFLPLVAGLTLAAAQPALSSPAPARPATASATSKLTAENRAALRCSAAFAIVTQRTGQAAGEGAELRARGREFFVVTLAELMDEHKLDRAAIEREVRAEAQKLSQSGEADQIMPACLLMLQAAGL